MRHLSPSLLCLAVACAPGSAEDDTAPTSDTDPDTETDTDTETTAGGIWP